MDIMPKSCLVTYETKLKQYIERASHLTGKMPLDIGIVFSSKYSEMVESFRNESSHLGINLHANPVIISDPENSIKSIVKNYISHYHIDFMIILDDDIVINDQNISNIWVPLLAPLNIPIAVPSDYFYDLEPRIGSFAIQPHYSEIGQVVASVINDAEANNYIINQKSIYTDKSIFYFRNKDGSISKQMQIQNQIVASFHPKTLAASTAQIPVKSEVLVSDLHTNLTKKDLVSYDSSNTIKSSQTLSSDPVVAINDPIIKKIPKIIEMAENKSYSNKKNDLFAVKPLVNSEPEKKQTENNDYKSKAAKQSSKQAVFLEVNQPDHQSTKFIASHQDRYNIEITTTTTNIFQELTPDLPVLRIGDSGDKLKVTAEDSLWYCVDLNGTPGFLSKGNARKLTQTYNVPKLSGPIVVGIIILIVVLLTVYVLLKLKIIRHNTMDRINFLLVAKSKKRIKYSNINNKSISLVKYLRNYGIHITISRNLDQTSSSLLLTIPDIICVDWQFETDIQVKIYEILKERMLTANFILIFYNVASQSSIDKNCYFDDHTFFFNKNFTISELNEVLAKVNARTIDKPQHKPIKSHHFLRVKLLKRRFQKFFK